MIKWLSTAINTPEANREIVAKNPLKPIGYNSSARQCRIMKFHTDYNKQQIKNCMLEDNLSLWAYTEGTSE